VALSLLLLTGTIGAGFAAFADVDLCDFRIPTTDLTQLFLTVHYTYLDLPDTPSVDVSSGHVSFTYSRVRDESDRAVDVRSTNELSFDRLKLDRVLGDANLTSRYYLSDTMPLYAFGEVRADYGTTPGQSGLELRLGSGYGRLTDVTPLAKALRIQDALRESLVLASDLSDQALQEIGRLVGQEAEFSGIGELVSRIEAVIETEAAVTLNARSLLNIAEIIRSTDASQHCGWAAQLGLGYELLPRFGGARQFLMTLSTDLARPLRLDAQVEVHADYSRPLLTSGASAVSASVHYNRRLSDSTRLVAEYALQRVKQLDREPSVGQAIEIQLLFDLGRIDLTATASLTRGTGMSGWVESLVVAARVDLL